MTNASLVQDRIQNYIISQFSANHRFEYEIHLTSIYNLKVLLPSFFNSSFSSHFKELEV